MIQDYSFDYPRSCKDSIMSMTLILRLCSDIELTGEAMEVIGDYYAELRSQADTNALPITVRTLETIIRLSTAAAKARLSTGARSSDSSVKPHISLQAIQHVPFNCSARLS